jgi:hypothetical protein
METDLYQKLADRVERILIRYEELKRTKALLEERLDLVTTERDSLRSRLFAARSRIDSLLDRLPPNTSLPSTPPELTTTPDVQD